MTVIHNMNDFVVAPSAKYTNLADQNVYEL